MLSNLIGIMAAMSLAPAPILGANALQIYNQEIPVQITLSREQERPAVPHKKDPDNLGISTSGKSIFVADVASGGVLYAKQPYDVRSIASITKLMTAMVVMESTNKLKGDLTFQDDDFDHLEKSPFDVGDTISRADAMRSLMVGSVNAAGHALARTSGMTMDEFIKNMNAKATDLGLKSAVFVDPTGIEPGNRANAADVAAMLTIALNFPEIRQAMIQPKISIVTKEGKTRNIDSTNLLLNSFLNKDPYKIVGAKTGSLPEAGYCLAQVTRNKEGHEVVAVLLDSDNHFSRYSDVKALTYWAFDSFTWND